MKLLALLLLGTAGLAFAQEGISSNGPLSGISEAPDEAVAVSPSLRYQLDRPAPIALAQLSAAEKLPQTHGRLRSTGVARALPANARSSGQWTSATATRRVWRALFNTAEAKVVRVHFVNFHVGDGAVYVTNPDNLAQTFRFTKDGPHGDGEFWSPLIHSNAAMVEWDPGEGAPATLRAPFEVDQLLHILTASAAPAGAPAAVAPGDYACYVDYLCGTPNWGYAEAQLNFIVNGKSYVCSGTLVNPRAANPSGGTAPKPLLLTANHCISTNAEARTLVAVQGDWYTSCGGSTRAPTYQVLGQALLANTSIEQGDHTLILLGQFPAGATWHLSGWNTGDLPLGSSAIGLSHPDGLPLKLSLGTRIGDVTTDVTDSNGNVEGTAPAADYFHMNWTQGLIGGGSSGSGVFDSSDHLYGTLTWGNGHVSGSQCGNEGGYGKLSTGYSSLQPWFETASGVDTISQMTSPANNGKLTASSATFTWGASASASEYRLTIGSAPGSANYFNGNTGTVASANATGLPADGSTLYVRLWTHLAIGWYYFDYTYTAFTATATVPVNVTTVFPSTAPAQSSALDITIYGSGFLQGAQVKVTGPATYVLAATFVNSSTLTVTLSAAILAAKATLTLAVLNPGGAVSATFGTFNVTAPVTTSYTDTTTLAHFAAGGVFVSGLYVFNNSNTAGQFQISFYDDSGRPISVPVSGFGNVSQFTDSINGNGTKYYEAGNGSANVLSGSAVMKSTSSSIVVQELFRNHAPDNNYFEASVSASRGSFEFLVPFDATRLGSTQSYTGFAIANLDTATMAKITCLARDSAGNVIPNALTVPNLSPLGHWADFNFPVIAGLRGTFDCTSNTKIAPVALRALGSSISSLPVTLK